MQIFCTEPLLLKGYNINFRPQNFFSKKTKTLLNIYFINVPTETPDQPLTDYLSEYADIVGEPLYIQQGHNGIPYYNGTRVYQVQDISTACSEEQSYVYMTTNPITEYNVKTHTTTGVDFSKYTVWEDEEQPENNQTTTTTATENQEQTTNEKTEQQNPKTAKT